jgi:hypothetical protein
MPKARCLVEDRGFFASAGSEIAECLRHSLDATVKLLLGHSTSGDVTFGYIRPSLDSVRDALNRTARSIDGEVPEGAILFRSRARQAPEMARLTASTADSGEAMAR